MLGSAGVSTLGVLQLLLVFRAVGSSCAAGFYRYWRSLGWVHTSLCIV